MSFSRVLSILTLVIAIAMAAYHMVYVRWLLQDPTLHLNTHLGFVLVLIFLIALRNKPKRWPLWLGMMAGSIVATGYVQAFYSDIADRQLVVITTADIIIGVILVAVVLEASRQAFGNALAIVALVCIVYAFLGSHFPEPFTTASIPPEKVLARLGIHLTGLYGSVLGASANYIFLFMIFGGVLQAAGGSRFFYELGKLVGRRFRSGPAMAAVVSSALVGMISGSPSANVAVSGTFTIPLMKKVGYSPESAGAIEAAASNGGQIMPPVMGPVGFVMASVLGIPYKTVMIAAALPAILYYFCLALYVQFTAMKMNIAPQREEVSFRGMVVSGPLFFVPLVIIVVLLLNGYSPGYSAFYAVVSVVFVSAIMSFYRRDIRSLGRWVSSFVDGAKNGAYIGAACACTEFITASLVMTGTAVRFPAIVDMWSGGHLVTAMLITLLVSLLLGGPMPTTAAYVIVSLVTTPLFIKLGLTPLQSHFAALYFAAYSLISPPVGTTCMVTCGIAGGSYMKTSFEAMKVGAAALVVPFLFIYAPGILAQPDNLASMLLGMLGTVVLVSALTAVLVNHYLSRLSIVERLLMLVSGITVYAYFPTHNHMVLIGGIGLFIGLTLWQLRKRKRYATPDTAFRSMHQ